MDTLRNLWAILFISIAIVGLQGDGKVENVTANSQVGNASSLALAFDQGNKTEARNKSASYTTEVVINSKNKHSWMNRGRGGGGGGGGGGYSWSWGGGGGGGGGGRGGGGGGSGWGWGGGGGGSGWWKWGCGGQGGGNGGGKRHHHRVYRGTGRFSEDHYKLGEFAQCMRKGRCKGMRLDCPLHCGGPCYYDCQDMCKAHCRRR